MLVNSIRCVCVCVCVCACRAEADPDSVPYCVLDSLLACPVDMRLHVARNVVLCGGVADTPGFGFRLYKELGKTIASCPRCVSFFP